MRWMWNSSLAWFKVNVVLYFDGFRPRFRYIQLQRKKEQKLCVFFIISFWNFVRFIVWFRFTSLLQFVSADYILCTFTNTHFVPIILFSFKLYIYRQNQIFIICFLCLLISIHCGSSLNFRWISTKRYTWTVYC